MIDHRKRIWSLGFIWWGHGRQHTYRTISLMIPRESCKPKAKTHGTSFWTPPSLTELELKKSMASKEEKGLQPLWVVLGKSAGFFVSWRAVKHYTGGLGSFLTQGLAVVTAYEIREQRSFLLLFKRGPVAHRLLHPQSTGKEQVCVC